MRFRTAIILRNGFDATPIGAAARVFSTILISATALNAQVAPPGHAAGPEAVMPQHNDRIIPLLARLADQASLSGDLTFAVRAEAQAATLLWPYDRVRARAIYRRAFGSLMVAHDSRCDDSATPKAASAHPASRLALTAVASQQVLHEMAERDPELAEDLVLAFTASVTGASADPESATTSGNCDDGSGPAFDASVTKRVVEWRDLLATVAFQIVERDPLNREARLIRSSVDSRWTLGRTGLYRKEPSGHSICRDTLRVMSQSIERLEIIRRREPFVVIGLSRINLSG